MYCQVSARSRARGTTALLAFATFGLAVGIASPTRAGPITGDSNTANGVAVFGVYTASTPNTTGAGGLFVLQGNQPSANGAALLARNTAGASATGSYGAAALIQITNMLNMSPALNVSTAGDGHAIFATSTARDYAAIYGQATSTNQTAGFQSAGVRGRSNNFRGVFGELINGQDPSQFGDRGYAAVAAYDSSPGGNHTSGLFAISNSFAVQGRIFNPGQSDGSQSARFTGGGTGPGTCYYDGGAGFFCSAVSSLRKGASKVDGDDVLRRLAQMPIDSYAMTERAAAPRFLGPTGKDFRAAFGLGSEDDYINTADAQGVALAAAKALIERGKADEAKIADQARSIAALEAEVAALRKASDRVAGLEGLVAQQAALIQRFGAQLDVLSRTAPTVRASAR